MLALGGVLASQSSRRSRRRGVLVPRVRLARRGNPVVPNPGFEQNCSGIPCWWIAPGPTGPGEVTTIGRDTSIWSTSGQASLKVTTTSPFVSIGPRSGCFPLSPGSYSGSLFYNVPAASTTTGIGFAITYFGTGDCDSSSILDSASNPTPATKDGAWHQFNASFTAPAGTVSAYVIVQISCTDCSNAFAYFDDVSLDNGLPSVVPNPGFEQNCSGIPSWWIAPGPTGPGEVTTIGRDTSTVHSGQASLKVTTTSPFVLIGPRSGCFPLSPGSYSGSLFYNVPAASTTTGIGFAITYFGTGRLRQFFDPGLGEQPDPGDKGRRLAPVQCVLHGPAGTVSAYVIVQISCTDCSNAFAYFDDVSLGTPPTAASFMGVYASPTPTACSSVGER